MRSIVIPLAINHKGLQQTTDPKTAIDQTLSLLMSTPCYSCAADPEFGFIFNNMRFEIFNENEGVVYNSSDTSSIFEGKEGLYDKKITGSSKNLNTFASELKRTINKYERRLKSVSVSMTYIREERKIYITVKGIIVETEADYQYTTTLNVWN
jgi:hypothetical protein